MGPPARFAVEVAVARRQRQAVGRFPRQARAEEALARIHEVDLALLIGDAVDKTVGQLVLEQRRGRAHDGPFVGERTIAHVHRVPRHETRLQFDQVDRAAGIGDAREHRIGPLHHFDAVHIIKREPVAGRQPVHKLRTGVAPDQNLGLVLDVQRHRTGPAQHIHQLVARLVGDQFLRHDADVQRRVLDQAGGARAGHRRTGPIAVVLRAPHFKRTQENLCVLGRRRLGRNRLAAEADRGQGTPHE